MADEKISQMAVATLAGTEMVEVVQGGVNKRTTTQDIADLGSGSGFVTQTLTADVDITGPTEAVRFGTGASHLDTFEVHTGTNLLLHAEDQLLVDVHDDVNPLLVTSIVASPTAFIVAGYDDGGTTPNALVQVNGGTAGIGVSISTASGSGNSIELTSDDDVNITGDSVNIINAATVIADAASMDIAAAKNTLTTSSATRTFTISYTGDDITLEITLSAAACVLTFPATTLCRYEGVSSGDNTMTLTGTSGDLHLIAIKKIGSNYRAVGANMLQ